MTQQIIAQDNIKLIAGRDDYSIYELKIEFERDYFSITYEGFEYNLLDDESGQERANDYIRDDDGEMWKSAVANDYTEQSKEDYINSYIDNTPWTEILGDITEINTDDKWWYTQMVSCGCSVARSISGLIKTKLTSDEIEIIKKADQKLHLKKLDYIYQHKQLNKLLNQVIRVFKKHEIKDFDSELYEYSWQFENKMEDE